MKSKFGKQSWVPICTVERYFSNLRRIKIWLRSVMVESRLNDIAIMSVNENTIIHNIGDFNNKVVEQFDKNPRRL